MNTSGNKTVWKRIYRSWIFRILISVTLGFIAVNSSVLFIHRLFRVQRIEIIGSNIQVVVDPKKLGSLLPFIATDSIADEIRAAHPELSKVEIYKKYPSTLVLDLVSKHPIATIRYPDGYASVDGTGFILSINETRDTSVDRVLLTGCDTSVVLFGKISDPLCVNGLKLISELTKANEITREITIRDRLYYQFKIGTSDIFIAHDADMPGIVTTLQTIMNRFRMKGTIPARINLRFAKPVVEM